MVNSKLLRLSSADNIAIAAGEIAAGTEVALDGQAVRVHDLIPVGHKVAISSIRAGEKIVKFACPIGSATCDIPAGRHVHTHNVKSDYIPTYTFEKGNTFVKE